MSARMDNGSHAAGRMVAAFLLVCICGGNVGVGAEGEIMIAGTAEVASADISGQALPGMDSGRRFPGRPYPGWRGPMGRPGRAREPRTCEFGFVITDGRYIPPPYAIVRESSSVFVVNGERVELTAVGTARPNPDEPEPGPWGGPGRSGISLWGTLNEDGLVVATGGKGYLIPYPESARVLREMVAKGEPSVRAAKIVSALDDLEPSVDFAWDVLIVQCGADDLLKERVGEEVKIPSMYSPAGATLSVLLHSPLARHGFVVCGMLLVVFALGNLLLYHPPTSAEAAMPGAGDLGRKHVPRYLLLLLPLSLYDLICTLMSRSTGEFEEMNPLATELVWASPLTVTAFKVLAVGLAMGIFWHLREHRRAQFGAWWACLVLALLTARWVTAQSLFIL